MNLGSPSKSLAEMAVESYNEEIGDMQGYDCPICKNKGMVAFLKDGQDCYMNCNCLDIRKANKMQAASGLYMLLAKHTFDNYRAIEQWQQYTLDKAKEFADKKDGWFFLGGRSGTGKTHICTAIIGQLLKEGIACKYMLWRDDVRELNAKVNTPEFDELIRPFKQTKVLYIDDFFKGGISQGDKNRAFEILNYRYLNGLMTVISSELLIKDILEIDEAIGGRIYQSSMNYLIQIKNGANYRLQGE